MAGDVADICCSDDNTKRSNNNFIKFIYYRFIARQWQDSQLQANTGQENMMIVTIIIIIISNSIHFIYLRA
jgi:hypothetical protein